MKKYIYFPLLAAILLVSACSVKKNLEISAPFTLGEAFGMEWSIEEHPKKAGYDVIIPIISLEEDNAILHNLYHLGQMAEIKIELREIGMVARAEFPSKDPLKATRLPNAEPFPFLLSEAEAVLSYLHKDKVRYIKISGILQNPTVVYPTLLARRGN